MEPMFRTIAFGPCIWVRSASRQERLGWCRADTGEDLGLVVEANAKTFGQNYCGNSKGGNERTEC
jgi:hypothetical protein